MDTYLRLRALIVSGDLAPDEVMTETSLAERLSVSRTPVREALERLEGDGLVVPQNRGIRVHVRSTKELVHVYRTRAALEAMAAEAAAERWAAGELAPARLTALTRAADETDQLTGAGDLQTAAAANRDFHAAIAAMAGNPVASEILDRLWDQVLVSTRQSLGATERGDAVAAEHRRLLACIEAGDGQGAAAAARDHVLATLSTPGSI